MRVPPEPYVLRHEKNPYVIKKVCPRCSKHFKNGQQVVITSGKGGHVMWHREHYLDAHGEPMFEAIKESARPYWRGQY